MRTIRISAAAIRTFIDAMYRYINVIDEKEHDRLAGKTYCYGNDSSKDAAVSDHGYPNGYTCYCREKHGTDTEPKYY